VERFHPALRGLSLRERHLRTIGWGWAARHCSNSVALRRRASRGHEGPAEAGFEHRDALLVLVVALLGGQRAASSA